MIRAGLLALALATPVEAQDLALCEAVWARAMTLAGEVTVTGAVRLEGDWCLAQGLRVDVPGEYAPDWRADRLRFRGGALGWMLDGSGIPDRLEVSVEGMSFAVQTGQPQTDYLFAAQSRAYPIQGDLALAWDPAGRTLAVERLEIDFPGANRVVLTATAKGVDLSSMGAAQMSATGFAVTEADLTVQTHGLFESYLLMALGSMFLPLDGDMMAAADGLRTQMISAAIQLPEASFPAESKDALLELIMLLPNPSGTLSVSMRAESGVGPARLMGFAMTGVPDTLDGIAPVLDGVRFDIGWTREATP